MTTLISLDYVDMDSPSKEEKKGHGARATESFRGGGGYRLAKLQKKSLFATTQRRNN